MSVAGFPSDCQPRAIGTARIGVALDGTRTRLTDLYQQGSAKCLLPRGDGVEAVLLNTAGGITGGDHLRYQADVGPGATLTLTTQAAERIYRAQPGLTGRIDIRLTLGPGARLDWLAQETILFDRAALARRLDVDMAPDARLLVVEPLVLGRQAMGETVSQARFTDHWRIRRGGTLVYADAQRLVGAVADLATHAGVLGGARAMASLLCIAPDAADRLAQARALLDGLGPGVEGGASAWNGLIAIRLVADDSALLRKSLVRFLLGFRGGLPRVWQS